MIFRSSSFNTTHVDIYADRHIPFNCLSSREYHLFSSQPFYITLKEFVPVIFRPVHSKRKVVESVSCVKYGTHIHPNCSSRAGAVEPDGIRL